MNQIHNSMNIDEYKREHKYKSTIFPLINRIFSSPKYYSKPEKKYTNATQEIGNLTLFKEEINALQKLQFHSNKISIKIHIRKQSNHQVFYSSSVKVCMFKLQKHRPFPSFTPLRLTFWDVDPIP
jgi:hypothetical protein